MYSFLKDQGYIWDSSLSGHTVYAPKGKNLKNKLEQYIRTILQRENVMEIESPLIYRKEVWELSGHWTKFQDPIVWTTSDKCFRLDKLIENFAQIKYESLQNWTQVQEILKEMNTKDPTFVKDPIVVKDEVEWKSLMMKTMSSHNEVGLRPETATATYQNFDDCFNFSGKQFPIKVFQIGKSFRNEIATRHNLIRGREFTQLELQIILPQDMKTTSILSNLEVNLEQEFQIYDNKDTLEITNWQKFLETFKVETSYFEMIYLTYQLFINLGLNQSNIRLRQHMENEKAFYALDAWDIEVNLKDLGWTEIAGIHDRGEYDLSKLLSKKWKKKGIPHILEMAIGIDRLLYCVLDNLFEEKDVQEGKSMLKIPYFLAPIQVSVLPLVKNKPEICMMGKEIYQNLKSYFITEYNDSGGIGKRYLKNAITGVPYCITVDFDSLENDDVTVRDRNTEEQVRVKVDELVPYLHERLRLK
jgi:glycyl-tRNA synthetase